MEHDEKIERLLALYKESMAEIRSRREVDHKIATFHWGFVSFIGGGTILSFSNIDHCWLQIPYGLVVIAAMVAMGVIVEGRLKHEHRAYESIEQSVVDIWSHLRFFEQNAYYDEKSVLPEKAKSFGKAEGYDWTIRIVWSATTLVGICVFLASIFL